MKLDKELAKLTCARTDHSFMHDDFHPYCVSYGDDVNFTTDYSQDAEIWMKPSKQGLKSSVVEIPGNAFSHPSCLLSLV